MSFFDKIKDGTSKVLNNSSKEEVTKYLVRVSLKSVHSMRMINPKFVNNYFILTRQGWFLLVADSWPDSL